MVRAVSVVQVKPQFVRRPCGLWLRTCVRGSAVQWSYVVRPGYESFHGASSEVTGKL
jgi:hypothetical protein